MNKLLSLQLFAEEGAKTFTQEELDKIIQDRLNRENEKHKKDLEDLKLQMKKQGKEGEEALKIDLEQQQKQNQELLEEIAKMRKTQRTGEVITMYAKDDLPCNAEFGKIAGLVSNIEDDAERATAYNDVKAFVVAVKTHFANENLKKDNPKGSDNEGGNNPFAEKVKNGNLTEIIKYCKENPAEAEKEAKEAGLYEKYKYYFE